MTERVKWTELNWCNIALYNIGPCFHHQSHPQLVVVFALVPSLHSFWVISLLIFSSILGTYWPGEFILQCSIFLPFHTVYWALKARISGLPFPSPVAFILSELSTTTHPSSVAIDGMAHSYIELDKAVVHVIRLVTFLWLWFQSVCPLMPFPSTYHLTGVSLTLDPNDH